MKIKVNCPNCGDLIEIEIDENFEVISVESVEEELIEVSSDILNELGIEFG